MPAKKSKRRKAETTTTEDKKRYQKPELVFYGGIRALTSGMGNDGNADGVPFPPKTFIVQ